MHHVLSYFISVCLFVVYLYVAIAGSDGAGDVRSTLSLLCDGIAWDQGSGKHLYRNSTACMHGYGAHTISRGKEKGESFACIRTWNFEHDSSIVIQDYFTAISYLVFIIVPSYRIS